MITIKTCMIIIKNTRNANAVAKLYKRTDQQVVKYMY